MSINLEEYKPECCNESLPWIKEPYAKFDNERKCKVCGRILELGESHVHNDDLEKYMSLRSH